MERRALILGLVWDIGLPAAAYYVCRFFDVGPVVALSAGGAVALLRLCYVAARRRRINAVATFMVVVFVVLLVGSYLTGDARVLLARESIVSGVAGLFFLGSCLMPRPALYHLMLRATADEEQRVDWTRRWAERPELRHGLTVISAVWGAGLVADALAGLPLILLLPVDVSAGALVALQIVALALLLGWTLWYRRRRTRSARTRPDKGAAEELVR